jgi:hypothetical protein
MAVSISYLDQNLKTSLMQIIVVQASSSRFGFFVNLILVLQVFLLASYVVYLRRQSVQPKKYL